jgi:hypothetical protein
VTTNFPRTLFCGTDYIIGLRSLKGKPKICRSITKGDQTSILVIDSNFMLKEQMRDRNSLFSLTNQCPCLSVALHYQESPCLN